jgi:hypothetical protein
MNASPWDALMRASVVRRRPEASAAPGERTKTQQLLDAIDQLGHVTTLRLCVETDLDSRAVWGLLKLHRKSGRVRFVYGEWSPGLSAQTIKAQQAAQLLRSLGWTVVEPARTAQKGVHDD